MKKSLLLIIIAFFPLHCVYADFEKNVGYDITLPQKTKWGLYLYAVETKDTNVEAGINIITRQTIYFKDHTLYNQKWATSPWALRECDTCGGSYEGICYTAPTFVHGVQRLQGSSYTLLLTPFIQRCNGHFFLNGKDISNEVMYTNPEKEFSAGDGIWFSRVSSESYPVKNPNFSPSDAMDSYGLIYFGALQKDVRSDDVKTAEKNLFAYDTSPYWYIGSSLYYLWIAIGNPQFVLHLDLTNPKLPFGKGIYW